MICLYLYALCRIECVCGQGIWKAQWQGLCYPLSIVQSTELPYAPVVGSQEKMYGKFFQSVTCWYWRSLGKSTGESF